MIIPRNQSALPLTISSLSEYGAGPILSMLLSPVYSGSNSYPSANLGLFYPFKIPFAYPVRRVFWVNGSAIAGNCDMGIYTEQGTRIFSTGSVAQSGSVVLQFVNTNFVLPPGAYMFGFACSSTGAQFRSTANGVASHYAMAGVLEQASAFPLPASPTFAVPSNPFFNHVGICRTRSVI